MVAPGSDYGLAMWNDMKRLPRSEFFDYVVDPRRKLLSKLHHVHFSFALNKFFSLPLQSLWRNRYVFRKSSLLGHPKTCVVFTDISACRTDVQTLRKLHERDNLVMVLVLVNVMDSKPRLLATRLSAFDQVYSFDQSDCERYGFAFHPTFYSVPSIPSSSIPLVSDAFFVGFAKGRRTAQLTELCHRLAACGGTSDFHLIGASRQALSGVDIHTGHRMDYAEALRRLQATNCVVELMGEGQMGLTLRAMEAICFNKKLLTNNPSVKDLRFYQSGFIRVFRDIEEVDVEWMKKREHVDFGYKGEFSPLHLAGEIARRAGWTKDNAP